GRLTGYIYTDRPVYRPDQKVYFKGIIRQLGNNGYEMAGERTAKVTIEDPNNGKVSEKNLPLSSRGTFSGEVEIVGGAPLGGYRGIAEVGGAEPGGCCEGQELKQSE